MNSIDIFFSATGNYAPFVATTALSVIENTKEPLRFHIISQHFDTDNKVRLSHFLTSFENVLSVDFFDIDDRIDIFDEFPPVLAHSIVYARLLIPELFSLPKAISIDLDIIVNSDIKELWNIDIKKYALAACPDISMNNLPHYIHDILKLSNNHIYFNGGLLILNCDKWRKENIIKKVFNILRKQENNFIWGDQDILNLCFDNNKYLAIEEIYNSVTTCHTEEKEMYNPKCFHFAGKIKPWLFDCFQSEVFWKFAQKTPYYEVILQQYKNNKVSKKDIKLQIIRSFAMKTKQQELLKKNNNEKPAH
jgi:lipopolysaccharide biosynthesis glycosyltransferase